MADELNNQYQGTQGHEQEVIKVEGLKASLQKMKDDLLGIPNTSEAVKYTQAEADAYNAQLTGALDDTTPLTAEQATAYNTAIAGATKEAGDTLSEAEVNLYNATLDGAVTTDDVKTPAVPTKVKDYVDTEVAKKYTKPTNGIPKSDLASGVKTSLGKADTSVQGVAYDTTNKKITKTINGSTTDVVTASAIVTDGNGVKTAISTTYSALKALRDNSQLVPGQRYRITDYVTTTVQTDTRSAGHAFDIIVFADEANKLNENAFAALHSGDTYFSNSKLEAWELKYCLDNDTNRFTWADTTNGKGVIYEMTDEWLNRLDYDFKNIQFKVCKVADAHPDRADFNGKYLYYSSSVNEARLPGNITIPDETDFIWAYTFSSDASGATDQTDMSLINGGIYHNKIGSVYPEKLPYIVFYGSNVNLNTMLAYLSCVCIGETKFFQLNTFEYCYASILADGHENFVTFRLWRSSIGGDWYQNLIRTIDTSSILGSFNSNRVLGTIASSVIGTMCTNNTISEISDSTIGMNFRRNIVGTQMRNANIAGYCQYNNFGNRIINLTIDKIYFYYSVIESHNQYLTITSNQTTGSGAKLQYIRIRSGVANGGSEAERKTISHNTVEDTFSTTYKNPNSTDVNV